MAKPGVILNANQSAASSVAVAVLCALGLVQLATLAHTGWQAWRGERTMTAGLAPQPASSPVKSSPASTPKKPSAFDIGTLPPLPKLPAGTVPLSLSSTASDAVSLPPLPKLPGEMKSAARPNTLTKSDVIDESHSPSALPQSYRPPPPIEAPPQPAAPPRPSSGNAQVDDLLEVARLSREANDADGALKALERADLISPDHPMVLREKALTLSKMGQIDKANALLERAAKLGPSAGTPMSSGAASPTNNLGGAFGAASTTGPLSLGQCTIARDPSDTTGEKVILKLPVRATPGASISPNDWNVDVFFYDKVDGINIEPTKSDPPVYSFDLPVDFKTGEEVVTVVYHMPRLSEKETAEFGRRTFHGYVAKLYYSGRLMGSAAAPRELLNQTDGGAPAANPLLPAPTR